jgi:hypothetical protein
MNYSYYRLSWQRKSSYVSITWTQCRRRSKRGNYDIDLTAITSTQIDVFHQRPFVFCDQVLRIFCVQTSIDERDIYLGRTSKLNLSLRLKHDITVWCPAPNVYGEPADAPPGALTLFLMRKSALVVAETFSRRGSIIYDGMSWLPWKFFCYVRRIWAHEISFLVPHARGGTRPSVLGTEALPAYPTAG